MKRKVSLYIALTSLFTLNAQNFDYLPAKVGNHQILKYDNFTISYNEEHEQADWVAYELTKDEVQMQGDRCNCFKKDPNVTTASASSSDYTNSGFEIGHLAPSADFYMSDKANEQTFYLSNMSPQSSSLNKGAWKELEKWIRTKTNEYEKIYIVTGPVFKNNLGTIGKNKVTIPGYFYKALLRFDSNGKPKTIGFLLPNIGAIGKFEDYIVPVNLLETLTGLDFFPSLPSSTENRSESQTPTKSWGL